MERAGNVFFGEALFVAALLRYVKHDYAALGCSVSVGCYSNPPIDGVISMRRNPYRMVGGLLSYGVNC
jgi:hypothetical protein